LSRPLSKSPDAAPDGWLNRRPSGGDAGEPLQTLAQAAWPGMDLAVCREDIRQPTHWSISQSPHTLIVHLDGAMGSLDTEIEGAGGCHVPPAPGDIWVVPSGHRYLSEARGQLITYAELHIRPDAGVELPDEGHARIDVLPPRMAHRDEFLHQAVVQLVRLAVAEDDLSVMMAERLQCLLRLHLLRDYRPGVQAPPPRGGSPALGRVQARRISDFVNAHLADPIRLADLAALVQMGVHQLLVAFRRSFHTTPAQYVVTQRLIRARWLLLNSNQDIARIAVSTGFASHSHFTSAFKRRMGLTPRQFRDGQRASRIRFPSAASTPPPGSPGRYP